MHKTAPPSDNNNIFKQQYSKSIYYMRSRVKSESSFLLGNAAHGAVLGEILTQPKPGLVDPSGAGCHEDMDWTVLMASAEALAPFWRIQAQTGLDGDPPGSAMIKLRALGIAMDEAMFAATKKVNTHKGLVYVMSLLLYGAGYAIFKGEELTAEVITAFAAKTVEGSVEKELSSLKSCNVRRPLTHGEKLFLEHGITGIRGEAERAFPSIMKAGLPELSRALRSGVGENDAALCALLAIMEVNEDSNVVHRGGARFWQNEYKAMVRETRQAFAANPGDYAPIFALEEKFLPLRISPGGAADLLACTLFLDFVTFSTCQQ